MTLVWPHYVSNVNFVSNWIYFHICLILDIGIWMILSFFPINVMWDCLANFIIDDSILPLGYVFDSWLKFYYCGHSLFLWFLTFALDVSSLMSNLNFEALYCEFYWQSDIWWAYQRDSWQSSGCITLGYGVISESSRAPPSPQDLSIGLVLSIDCYE